jgi:sec-independent protein translocase protein TatB
VFNISATELLVIAVVALLVLGPDKLPEAMRKLGRATREIRRITSGFEAELRDALSDAARRDHRLGRAAEPDRSPRSGTDTGTDTSGRPGTTAVPGRDRGLTS